MKHRTLPALPAPPRMHRNSTDDHEKTMSLNDKLSRLLRGHEKGENFNPSDLGLEFEKAGDLAFDRIVPAVVEGNLDDDAKIRALRALGLLCGHFCVPRMLELLDLCARVAGDPSLRVRSAAVHGMVALTGVAEMVRTLSTVDRNETIARVVAAVHRAVDLGVKPEAAELATRFLTSRSAPR